MTKISFSDLNIFPCGTKTIDWDWRSNLKPWDIIDCFDRSKWYPSTITSIHEEYDSNGIKYVVYHVGFRLYPEHFNNPEEPDDIAKKIRLMINGLAGCGLNAAQTTNEDLKVILNNF